jgi:hypothetical protein
MQKKRIGLLAFASLPLFLAACGGEVPQPYHGTPYDGRTAGSGVIYVREHMAPPADVNTEPQVREEAPAPAVEEVVPAEEVVPEPAPAPATSGDKVFHKATEK